MKAICFIALYFSFSCYSQDRAHQYFSFHGVQNDTLVSETSKTDSVKPHSITKAVLLSIVPGGGQIYNHIAMPKGKKKAYWKVPLIYAGLGATGYFLITNQKNVKSLREEYNYRQDNNGEHKYETWDQYNDDSDLLILHDQYQTWRDLSVLGVGLVYVLQLVDAGVEAHFVNFDVSQNLSLSIKPTLVDYQTAGLSMSLKFR